MSKFQYTAKDASGQTVIGWIRAETMEAARESLHADGRRLQEIILTEVPDAMMQEEDPIVDAEPVIGDLLGDGVESNEEQIVVLDALPNFSSVPAMPILENLDRLAEQGIPFGDGLKAIADEMPSIRHAKALRALADRLDAGDSLQEAMMKLHLRPPRSMRQLIESGVSPGQFSLLLHQLVHLEQERRQLWSQALGAMLYPGLLLLALMTFSILVGLFLVPTFENIYNDFGVELPRLTEMAFSFFRTGQWFLFGGIGLFILLYFSIDFLPLPQKIKRSLYWVPLIGSIRRWHRLTRYSRLLALLTKERVPLPAATRLAADGMGSNEVAVAGHTIAEHIEEGISFAKASEIANLYPPSCESILFWGEKNHVLPESLEMVGDISKTRMQTAVDLMGIVAIPLTLILFLTFIPFFIFTLLLPLIRGICFLSS